jgi:hypothetical protein
VNRSRWLPIAGLGLALLIVTLDILERAPFPRWALRSTWP